jgi:hypothetical protein
MRSADHIMYNYCGNRSIHIIFLLTSERDGLDSYLQYLQHVCKFKIVGGLKQNNLGLKYK